MYARMTTGQLRPGGAAASADAWRKETLTQAKEEAGFRGAFFLHNPTTGAVHVLTLWDGTDDVEASARSGAASRAVNQSAPFFATAPQQEVLQVDFVEWVD
jgi:heme-degrading monooxygenase HmoA